MDDVRQARRQLDQRPFDWWVNAPMALLCLAIGFVMTRAIQRRFYDDRVARVAAVVIVSAGLGVLIIGVGQVWAFGVELARIGNAHLGYRGLRIPWGHHRLETFTLAVFATWTIALSAPNAPKAP